MTFIKSWVYNTIILFNSNIVFKYNVNINLFDNNWVRVPFVTLYVYNVNKFKTYPNNNEKKKYSFRFIP